MTDITATVHLILFFQVRRILEGSSRQRMIISEYRIAVVCVAWISRERVEGLAGLGSRSCWKQEEKKDGAESRAKNKMYLWYFAYSIPT